MKFNPDDSKYTAYVLNELDAAGRAAVEREMAGDPAVRAHVDELRTFVGRLEQGLAQEPDVTLEPGQRSVIMQEAKKKPAGRLLRLPVWTMTSIGTAAAALVIGFFVVQDQMRQAALREERLAAVDARATSQVTSVETEPAMEVASLDDQLQRLTQEVLEWEAESPTESPAVATPSSPDLDFAALDVMQVDSPLAMQGLFAGRSERGRRQSSPMFRVQHMPEVVHAPPVLSPSLDDFPERHDNTFVRVEDHPLSTFSIDVDTASYAIMRRLLADGLMPPADAIRVEELINYFPYDYQPPTDGKPFAAHFEAAPCPWQPAHQLVRIALKGKELSAAERPALNLVYLIDVSGSMNPPNRLPLVKRALQALARQLDERDHVAIVVYSGSSGLVLPPTRGDRPQVILDALERLKAGGSTAGGAGIQLAYTVAREHFNPEAVNRVILCTDGDFNVGVTQRGDLERLIEQEAKSGVFLTVLGFGMGNLKDSTLELLSNKGNGNYAYIDDFSEARKVLVDEMMGTLVTIAKDVKIQVEFNPAHVAGYRLIGYENRLLKKEDFNNDKVDAGDIGAGHTVTAFYELIPVGAPVTDAPVVDDLKYQSRQSTSSDDGEWLTVKMRYKEPDGETSSRLDFPLHADAFSRSTGSLDYRFAASVAAFGQLLRGTEHLGDFGYEAVIGMAQESLGNDPFGYRAEFLKLVRNAQAVAGAR